MTNLPNTLELTVFQDEKHADGENFQTTTHDFINCFKKPKIRPSKEGSLLIGPYTLNNTLRRKNENVESVTMLVFDIDKAGGKTFEEIYGLVKNYMGYMHTSYRHTENQTRCRIFLFLDSPIPKDKFEIVRKNFLQKHSELNRIIDQSCSAISTGYFAFACPKERKEYARSKILDGKLLNWKDYEQYHPSSPENPMLIPEGYRYTERCKLIGRLIQQGLSLEEVRRGVLDWNKTKCYPPENEDIVIRNINGIWEKDKREKIALNHALGIPNYTENPIDRYKLLSWEDLKKAQELEWRVKKIFPKKGLASIYGPSMSGKSFLAIDMALHIALGESWFGNRVSSGEVIYCMLEGEYGLKNRVKAWEKANSKSCPNTFKAFLDPFRINNIQDVEDFTRILPKGCVVIIDTLNRSAPDADENSSKDMGLIIDGMKKIQSQCEGLVICVHHTGKDVSKGLRGHSSLLAALDSAIQVERTQTLRSWTLAKSKEGEDEKTANFQLQVQELGKDSDGDLVTSCSVSRDVSHIVQKREPSGKQQKAGLTLIRKLLSQSNIKNKCTSGANTQCITVAEAIEKFSETLTTHQSNKRRSTARRVIQGLIDNDFLVTGSSDSEDWIWEK